MHALRRCKGRALTVLLCAVVLWGCSCMGVRADPRTAIVVALDGAIGPATAAYVLRSLDEAARRKAAVVVLRLDTPGGLDSAMRDIIRAVLASPVPVIGYVAPGGARAASAGTYILYATSLAAMAPGTNLGAATPVSLVGETPLPGAPRTPAEIGPSPPKDAELTKITNDAAAYIRSLATLHGRNADWAERAVREAVSLSYEAALREHVIDFVAANTPDLLAAADSRTVVVAGQQLRLATRDLVVRDVGPDWRDRMLATLTNPGILYLLLLAGLVGVAFELSHPGVFAPGVLGVICLVVGGYGRNLLPIDYAGVALALFGIGLMVAEAWVPAFGAFVIGGAAAFLIGSLMMFENPVFRPSLSAILAATLGCVALFGVVLAILVRARRQPVVSGNATLIGAFGHVIGWLGTEGQVMVGGEHWNARATSTLDVGGRVRVTARDGLCLTVEAV